MQVSRHIYQPERAVCKTVGSAYVGSNPTPATTCGNGPLAADSRLCGPFFLCPVMCHLVALGGAVSRCPRTYSGRDPCPRTVGAHRRLFYGRPRTGPCQRRVPARRAPLSRVCGCFGDRVDGVLTLGYSRQAPCAPCPLGMPSSVSFAIRPSWRRPALHRGHVTLSAVGRTSPVVRGYRAACGPARADLASPRTCW